MSRIGLSYMKNKIKWTNRLSIERKRVCEKCAKEDYNYKLYIEKQRIFYCCEECAVKHNLTNL